VAGEHLWREYVVASTLRGQLAESYRQAEIYAGRILMGEQPADLPVQAPMRYEPRDQAKDCQEALDSTCRTLFARAGEVIEEASGVGSCRGFRTPAPVQAAPSRWAGIRKPAQGTKSREVGH
jgi:hypothetical protein